MRRVVSLTGSQNIFTGGGWETFLLQMGFSSEDMLLVLSVADVLNMDVDISKKTWSWVVMLKWNPLVSFVF